MFVAKAFRAVHFTCFKLASSLRITWFRLCFPGLEVGCGVTLGRGVRVRVMNNARLHIGDRAAIEPGCQIESDGILIIGKDSFVGKNSVIVANESITIGEDALIAANVTIRDQDHGTSARPYRLQPLQSAPIAIGDNVWLGSGATILKGITVGDNAVVAAGAVVTRPVTNDDRVAGVPARPISNSTGRES